jgi:hypothetical protein
MSADKSDVSTITPTLLQNTCTTLTVDSGHNVYSYLVRVSRNDLNSIGCVNGVTCPDTHEWRVVLVKDNEIIDSVKPLYIVP